MPEAEGVADFVGDGADEAGIGQVDELASADAADVGAAGEAVAAAELDVVGFGSPEDKTDGGCVIPGADGGFEAGGDVGDIRIDDVGDDTAGPAVALPDDDAGGAVGFGFDVADGSENDVADEGFAFDDLVANAAAIDFGFAPVGGLRIDGRGEEQGE